MKKINLSWFLILMLGSFMVMISCGNRNFLAADSAEYKQLLEEVNSLDFEIENDWAKPLRGNRISLIGNSNYIRFENDSVDVFLPFFGVRHSGGGYGTDGAMVYQGPLENLRIEEMSGRGRVILSFRGNHKSEILEFSITFFPGGKTSTSVNSSQRDRMGYEGMIVKED